MSRSLQSKTTATSGRRTKRRPASARSVPLVSATTKSHAVEPKEFFNPDAAALEGLKIESCVTCFTDYLEQDMDTVVSVLDFKQRRQCRHCSAKKVETWAALAAWCNANPGKGDPWKILEKKSPAIARTVRFLAAGRVLPCRQAVAVLRRTQLVVREEISEEEMDRLYIEAWQENLDYDRAYEASLMDIGDDPEIEKLLRATARIAANSPVVGEPPAADEKIVSIEKARRLSGWLKGRGSR